ncbi:MAG: nucleotide-binding protein [bacterium]|nr:nucleotide-binding protein [bacterium]
MKAKVMVYLIVAAVIGVMVFGGMPLMSQETAKQKKDLLERGTHKGEVLETMDSGGYTYVRFREKDQTLWVAARRFQVKKGDTVEFSQAAPIKNFQSKTLGKTFDTILFVGSVKVNGKVPGRDNKMQLPKGHVPLDSKPAPDAKKSKAKVVTVTPGSIKKAAGGYTVAQCYKEKDTLNGKKISVRGRVVKFTPGIMGRNWLHIKDGSGEIGADDLTVTTQQEVKTGDLVLVTGTIVYDKNFGAGYIYKVIVEKATVVVE